MVALGKNEDGALWLGPVIRDRISEVIAQDIAEAVRKFTPGAAVMLEGGTPYGRFLAEAAAEVWKELQAT